MFPAFEVAVAEVEEEDEVPVVVAVAELTPSVAEDAAVAVAVALLDTQDTASGTVTPAVLHRFCAYATAEAWSAASQAPARQHAMPLRKVWLEQIQAMSSDPQPAIWSPDVY